MVSLALLDIVSCLTIYAILVMPATLRGASTALDESVPSIIFIAWLKFDVKVILEKAGFDVKDIAIGSRLQF